jgi:hypothetical protein
MKGQTLPGKDHISRYCKPTSVTEGGVPTGQSFALRPVDNNTLSVNWLEYYGNIDQDEQINHVREDIGLKLAARGLFAVLNVGEVIDYIQNVKILSVIHEPTDKDPSHSIIKGYDVYDQMVANMIAEKVIKTYAARPSSKHQ